MPRTTASQSSTRPRKPLTETSTNIPNSPAPQLASETAKPKTSKRKSRELDNADSAPPKRAKKNSSTSSQTNKASTSTTSKTKKKGPDVPDLSDIKLEGEDRNTVPIFDTCNEVRKKMTAFEKKTGISNAAFCRELSKMFREGTENVSTRNMSTFRTKKKPSEGCANPAYYAGYCFFEKLRLKEGKGKSKHREEMESRFPPSGVIIDKDIHITGLWTMKGESVTENKFGEWFINGEKLKM